MTCMKVRILCADVNDTPGRYLKHVCWLHKDVIQDNIRKNTCIFQENKSIIAQQIVSTRASNSAESITCKCTTINTNAVATHMHTHTNTWIHSTQMQTHSALINKQIQTLVYYVNYIANFIQKCTNSIKAKNITTRLKQQWTNA